MGHTEFNTGVLGETALPGLRGLRFESADQGRSALPVDGGQGCFLGVAGHADAWILDFKFLIICSWKLR